MHAFSSQEIFELRRMLELERLDIRCMTIGVNLLDCADRSLERTAENVYRKLVAHVQPLVPVCDEVESMIGIPIVNKRCSITPMALVANPAVGAGATDLTPLAEAMDRAARECGIDFIGGFSAHVQKGATKADQALLDSLPEALGSTERVCGSVNVATSKAGINMNAIRDLGVRLKQLAERTAAADGIGCAKFVAFANVPQDNPFMAGAQHGIGEPDVVVNCGVSGPGVVASVLEQMPKDADLG